MPDNTFGDVVKVLMMSVIPVVAPSILSTVVIPRKIRANATWHIERTFDKKKRGKPSKVELEMRHQDMVLVLQDAVTFDLFMRGLHKEVSHELGYAMIEMVQFKQFIRSNQKAKQYTAIASTSRQTDEDELKLEYGNDSDVCINIGGKEGKQNKNQNNDKDKELTITTDVSLSRADRYLDHCPSSAPRSTIVHTPRPEMSDAAKYRVIAHALWEKYISCRAKWEVNLSFDARQYYRQCVADNWMYEPEKLFGIFDFALLEITILLEFVYSRHRAKLDKIKEEQVRAKEEKKRQKIMRKLTA